MSYTPRPEDIAFANLITKTIRNGGTWGIPATGQFFHFDTEHKIMKLMNPETLTDGDSQMLYERAQAVFGKIGWKVEAQGNA